jgi:ferredoxin
MPRTLRVRVDYDRCTGVGACEQVCPEVFFMRDDGLPEVLEAEPHETLWAAVERAEEACPDAAVILEWIEE